LCTAAISKLDTGGNVKNEPFQENSLSNMKHGDLKSSMPTFTATSGMTLAVSDAYEEFDE
jgi:hypothetical protein